MSDFLTNVSVRVAELEAEIKEVHLTHVQQLSLLRREFDQLEQKLVTLTQCHIISTNPVLARLKRVKADLHQEVNRLQRQSQNLNQ